MDPNATMEEILKQLFHGDGNYDRALELIEALAEWIAGGGYKPEETTDANWDDILIGAYWYCADNHAGQWSDEYRLLSIISGIYSPGPLCNGPESLSVESDVYTALTELNQ